MLLHEERHDPRSALSARDLKSVLAFAEAIIPGSTRVPAADEATVARVERVVGEASPDAMRAFAKAVRVLDELARLHTGKAFHALDRDAQDRLLARWEAHPVFRTPLHAMSYAFKIAHFDRTRTYKELGGELRVIRDEKAPRWEERIIPAAEWTEDTDIECDVVVVGTGAGGAVVGRELALRGHVVVYVEEGRRHKRTEYTGSFVNAHATYYRNTLTLGNTPITLLMGKLVGGSTAVNGGTSLRPPKFVHDEWCETLGWDGLSAENLAPHFDRVEATLGVREPERKYIGPIADVIDRGAATLGWKAGPIPRNSIGCEGQGFCDFGCATGARRSVDVAYLPSAIDRGATVLTGLPAEEILLEGGRAVGIRGRDANGRTFRVRGKAVVLSGGAVPTPMLLLRQGLANSSGEVGKNLSLHPSAGVGGVFDERLDPEKYIPQGYMIDEFLAEGQLSLTAQPDLNIAHMVFPTTGRRLMSALDALPHLAMFGALIRDTSRGRIWFDVKKQPAMTYNLNTFDVANLQSIMVRTAELLFTAGARRVHMGMLGQGPIGSMSELRDFGAKRLSASDMALISYHPLGTCRMGRDPRSSVVDFDHQCHDVPGLFVVDGSTVPGPLGVNPQIIIMTMATRAAERIDACLHTASSSSISRTSSANGPSGPSRVTAAN